MTYDVEKPDEQWRAELTPGEYAVLRQAATEPPFVGKYTNTKTVGTYSCRACGAELFRSGAKFESHCGWPSFYGPKDTDAVELVPESSDSTEVRCARCGSHLLVVRPPPTVHVLWALADEGTRLLIEDCQDGTRDGALGWMTDVLTAALSAPLEEGGRRRRSPLLDRRPVAGDH